MTTYIKLSTQEYPRHQGDIDCDPAGAADYAEVQWVDCPAFDATRERCNVGAPKQRDGQWYTVWVTTPIPDSEQAKSVRDDRNKRLIETDWTQVADAPVDKAAWATYRQALRDIPSQAGFPWDIQWPVEP